MERDDSKDQNESSGLDTGLKSVDSLKDRVTEPPSHVVITIEEDFSAENEDGKILECVKANEEVVVSVTENVLKISSDDNESEEKTLEGVPISSPTVPKTDDEVAYEEYIKKRECVRLELEEIKSLEESEMKVFNTFKRFTVGENIFPIVRESNFHTVAFTLMVCICFFMASYFIFLIISKIIKYTLM